MHSGARSPDFSATLDRQWAHRSQSQLVDSSEIPKAVHPLASGSIGSAPGSRAHTPFEQRILHLPANAENDSGFSQEPVQGSAEDNADERNSQQKAHDVNWSTIVLKRADDAEAEGALAKLERMKKQKDTTRRWMKGTGASLLVKHRRKSSESVDLSLPDASTPDLSGEPAEVTLGIVSRPEYSVMGVRNAAQDTAGRIPDKSRLSLSLSRTQSPLAAGTSDAMGSRAGESSVGAKPGIQSAKSPLQGPHYTSSTSVASPEASTSRLLSPLGEELKAVEEERQDEEVGRSARTSPQQGRDEPRSRPRIPTLHIQEPSEASAEPTSSPYAPPSSSSSSSTGLAVRPVAVRKGLSLGVDGAGVAMDRHSGDGSSSASQPESFLGEQMYDEPEGDDDFPRQGQHPSALDRDVRSQALYENDTSSDSDVEEVLGSATARRGTADDSSEDEASMAQLSLQHGQRAMGGPSRRKVKREMVPSANARRGTLGHVRATSLGDRVTRGLTYASSESRNRRAMEKYTPAPARVVKQGDSRSTTPTLGAPFDLSTTFFGGSTTSFSERPSPAVEEPGDPLFTGSGYQQSLAEAAARTRDTPFGGYSAQRLDSERGANRTDNASPQLGSYALHASRSETPPLQSLGTAGPGSALDPRRASISSITSPGQEPSDRFSFGLPRRTGTFRSVSLAGTGERGGAHPSHTRLPRPWRPRQRRKWKQHVVEECKVTPDEELTGADPDQELDDVLGNLILEEDPDQVREKYDWDVLYENQRGLLFFGIPKFSARVLMQWDPAPWTDRKFQNSPYNIVNAQLPDTRWDWVYPEWLIDMSGDVDESGWQYSGSFGRIPISKMSRYIGFQMAKRAGRVPQGSASGEMEMEGVEAATHRKQEKRKQKEQTREDDGVEALKRSIKARGNKWTGRPDGATFVRRRRWIRLRKRRGLVPAGSLPKGDSSRQSAEPVQGVVEVAHTNGNYVPKASGASLAADSTSDSGSSLTSSDEEDDSSSDGESASVDSDPSAVSPPHRLAEHPRNSSHASDPRKELSQAKRQRRHQKEFTGTLRELKHLLPAILDPKGALQHSLDHQLSGQDLALGCIDARNPYISWKFVKKRLNEDDMSWKTTALRQRERHYQTRKCDGFRLPTRRRTSDANGRRQFPASLGSRHGTTDSVRQSKGPYADGTGNAARRSSQASIPIFSATDANEAPYQDMFAAIDAYELTKDALVDINWVRVKRVLRACNLDRQRLDLWRLWLGLDGPILVTSEQLLAEGETALHLAATTGNWTAAEEFMGSYQTDGHGRRSSVTSLAGPSTKAPRRRHTSQPQSSQRDQSFNILPDANDVWDLLERRIDSILILFEFNGSRAYLLKLLLSIHDGAHGQHRHRPETWSFRDEAGKHYQRTAPQVLAPWAHGPRGNGHSTDRIGQSNGNGTEEGDYPENPYNNDWVAGLATRLQFYSDVQEIATSLQDHSGARNSFSPPRPEATSAGLGISPRNGETVPVRFRSPFAEASSNAETSAGPSSANDATPSPPHAPTNTRGQPVLHSLRTSPSALFQASGRNQQSSADTVKGSSAAVRFAQNIGREPSPRSRSPAQDHASDLGYHGPFQSHYQLQAPRVQQQGTSQPQPQQQQQQQQQPERPKSASRLSPSPLDRPARHRGVGVNGPPRQPSPGQLASPTSAVARAKHPLSTMRNASPDPSEAESGRDSGRTSLPPSRSSTMGPRMGPSPAPGLRRDTLPSPGHLDPVLQSNPSAAFQKEQLRRLLMGGGVEDVDADAEEVESEIGRGSG
ncbi:hypothetical protein BCV69DRAFT_276399 [Microstroma glucosiphilum]|uniref:Uncharacterized protein n=1 Tax=Pseudomicrostroma glucosiphilum TaxID=1684307 RepID=A0A316UDM2_9BASI|nr:hypothetical protein BCV69DRAFT_276399 [Pseudomicrostroma glucosiphilum]PWN22473.1 hypothetical protein BCV69DRAFT_276399 [Pseudomicrostroma glucosiphilum]